MLTYGFYNSKDHDRTYDAIQMSSIFDGIVRDGIFMSIGDCFRVKQDSGMTVLVSPGRAWFNHTWTLNDASLPITIPQSEVILNRIDAIVIEINAELAVRANSIKVIKGTPATNPVRPTLTNTRLVHQYPLCYISVSQRVTEIRQADITNMIGTSQTPFVTGILDTINIDMLVAQWEDQWKRFYENQTDDMEKTNEYWKQQWENWYSIQKNNWIAFYEAYEKEMVQTGLYWKNRWEQWFYQYVNINSNDIDSWKHENQDAFTAWWNDLKDLIDGNVETEILSDIIDIKKNLDILNDFRDNLRNKGIVYVDLEADCPKLVPLVDENGEEITDEGMIVVDGMVYEVEPVLASDFTVIELARTIPSLDKRIIYSE